MGNVLCVIGREGKRLVMNSDYKVEAIDILLNEDCILQRYVPLVPYKHKIIKHLKKTWMPYKIRVYGTFRPVLIGHWIT